MKFRYSSVHFRPVSDEGFERDEVLLERTYCLVVGCGGLGRNVMASNLRLLVRTTQEFEKGTGWPAETEGSHMFLR